MYNGANNYRSQVSSKIWHNVGLSMICLSVKVFFKSDLKLTSCSVRDGPKFFFFDSINYSFLLNRRHVVIVDTPNFSRS